MRYSASLVHPRLTDLSTLLGGRYGGPNSQIITTKFQRDFHHYLATSLDYIVVRVDPRGTGFRGRKFRSTVRGRLGEIERQDVIEVARRWAHKAYVDEKRIGVWGWVRSRLSPNHISLAPLLT